MLGSFVTCLPRVLLFLVLGASLSFYGRRLGSLVTNQGPRNIGVMTEMFGVCMKEYVHDSDSTLPYGQH